jgi:hypothetical protein
MYNLVNTVTSPTRITSDPLSLIDIIITNKQYYRFSSTALDLGYSDPNLKYGTWMSISQKEEK